MQVKIVPRAMTLGPSTLRLIEDARPDLACSVLGFRESDTDPDIKISEAVPSSDDHEAVNAFQQTLIKKLSAFDEDQLRPLEERCRRLWVLAEGKGVSSLDTITGQQLDRPGQLEFQSQPDALCRSIWAFLNARTTFEDSESFYFARQFRDYGRLYDAFEVELGRARATNADSINEAALGAKITTVLELRTACTVKALDLPATATHPASIMLIVRHGGPLSSVHDHKDDGRRGTIYYRPPNEATLIYTPSMRQIEVCADSPVVRQKVASAIAEVILGYDVSQKPLTWKHYNLSRFRTALRLPLTCIDGYDIRDARVIEAEIRLGAWSRKLSLKVTVEDDIDTVAARYLKPNNIFKRADGFSRIGIAVIYSRVGEGKERSLNITISGSKSCNLQSNRDPDERALGYALLKAWGILSAFRELDSGDLRAMFLQLVQLDERVEDEVSGAYLREVGLDPRRLVEGGLLERRSRQDIVLLEDDIDAEITAGPSPMVGMVRTIGLFGEAGGERPASDFEMYAINRQWLHETVLRLMKPLLSNRASLTLDPDLTLLGTMPINGADAPVYFARRLDDLKTVGRLDLALRGRKGTGVGIVLSASAEMPGCLGANVVVPLMSIVSSEDEEFMLSRNGIQLAHRNFYSLARGGAAPQVIRSGKHSATLHVPGKDPLNLIGGVQIAIFERLVNAHKEGTPDVQVKELMVGRGSLSPQQAFRKSDWKSILDVYISKGGKRGYWRLLAEPVATDKAV